MESHLLSLEFFNPLVTSVVSSRKLCEPWVLSFYARIPPQSELYSHHKVVLNNSLVISIGRVEDKLVKSQNRAAETPCNFIKPGKRPLCDARAIREAAVTSYYRVDRQIIMWNGSMLEKWAGITAEKSVPWRGGFNLSFGVYYCPVSLE